MRPLREFRARHGASATTWSIRGRVVLTGLLLVVPAVCLLLLVSDGTLLAAWWVLMLLLSLVVAGLILRSVWVVSDDAVRDDNLMQGRVRRIARRFRDDEGLPSLHDREPPRRW